MSKAQMLRIHKGGSYLTIRLVGGLPTGISTAGDVHVAAFFLVYTEKRTVCQIPLNEITRVSKVNDETLWQKGEPFGDLWPILEPFEKEFPREKIVGECYGY